MDRGSWWAAVRGVTQREIQLKGLSTHSITSGSGHTYDISSLPAVLRLLSGGEDWGLAPGILLSTGEHTNQRRLGSCFKSREGDFPGGPVVKNPPANAGDMDWIPGPGIFYMSWGS